MIKKTKDGYATDMASYLALSASSSMKGERK